MRSALGEARVGGDLLVEKAFEDLEKSADATRSWRLSSLGGCQSTEGLGNL